MSHMSIDQQADCESKMTLFIGCVLRVKYLKKNLDKGFLSLAQSKESMTWTHTETQFVVDAFSDPLPITRRYSGTTTTI